MASGYVVQVRRLANGTPLYLGRDGQINCRAIEEAQVYKTDVCAGRRARVLDGAVVPVVVGERTKGRGPYAKARA